MVRLCFLMMVALVAVGLLLTIAPAHAAEEVAIDRMQTNWNESSTEPVPAAAQGVRIVPNVGNALSDKMNNAIHCGHDHDYDHDYEWNDDIRRQLGSAGRRIGVSPSGH